MSTLILKILSFRLCGIPYFVKNVCHKLTVQDVHVRAGRLRAAGDTRVISRVTCVSVGYRQRASFGG